MESAHPLSHLSLRSPQSTEAPPQDRHTQLSLRAQWRAPGPVPLLRIGRVHRGRPMSALGQKRTLRFASPMSALPPKAHSRATVGCPLCAKSGHSTVYSIISSMVVGTVGGEANPSALIACRLIASAQNGRTSPRGLRYSTRSGAKPYAQFDNSGTERKIPERVL
jgi:hypothetical protein